jgi:hypothetical protein
MCNCHIDLSGLLAAKSWGQFLGHGFQISVLFGAIVSLAWMHWKIPEISRNWYFFFLFLCW